MSAEQKSAFRKATSEDADMVRHLVRAAYAKWEPVIGREPLPMAADYDRAVKDHDIDMLYSGEVLVGVIETVLHPDHLWIENVAVLPEAQGKGFGKKLLAHAEEKALQSACREIRLLTNEAFTANVELYQRVGFVIDKCEPFHLGGITVYMSKELHQPTPAP